MEEQNQNSNAEKAQEENKMLEIVLNLQKEIKMLKNSNIEKSKKSKKQLAAPQVGASEKLAEETPQRVNDDPALQFDESDFEDEADDDDEYNDEYINVHASASNIDTETEEDKESDMLKTDFKNPLFSDIKVISDKSAKKGEKIDNDWSKIVNDSWKANKDKEDVKKLRDKYLIPENCEIQTPKLNVELWQLLSSTQRKSDVRLAMIQRNLASAAGGIISLVQDVLKDDCDKKKVIQKSTDVIALLGHASSEVSVKRKFFVRSVLKDDYKDLVSITGKVTDQLFGDNLSKNIKDINLTNKLRAKSSFKDRRNKKFYNRSDSHPYNRQNNQSFLYKGRRGMSSSTQSRNPKK